MITHCVYCGLIDACDECIKCQGRGENMKRRSFLAGLASLFGFAAPAPAAVANQNPFPKDTSGVLLYDHETNCWVMAIVTNMTQTMGDADLRHILIDDMSHQMKLWREMKERAKGNVGNQRPE